MILVLNVWLEVCCKINHRESLEDYQNLCMYVRLCNNNIQLLKLVFLFLNQVFGIGVPNPYRLRPFIGARVPVNSSFSPIINIHNPHSEPLQVSLRENC